MKRTLWAAIAFCVVGLPRPAAAYGVLAHEAIIDSVWDESIAPLLRARFHVSSERIARARAYAYGGAIIQDSGYYPLSSRTFGDFTHYVRSGDFIAALLREASNVDEYAFALGAMAHYAADNDGHPVAINRSVPLMYPKLEARYGERITYEDNPSAHLRTEFGFDVVQVARGAYLPQAYHSFIGFEVSTPVLERAFRSTYGLELKDVFGNYDLAIGTFRWAVGQVIPTMTKVAWQTKRKDIQQRFPDATADNALFRLSRADYEESWGTTYRRPNLWHRILGWLFLAVPKIGPFRPLAFKPPTPEAERLFLESFNATVARYRTLVAAAGRGRPSLENRNFDTGQLVRAGDYRLVDDAYADWLHRLADHHFEGTSPAVRANLLSFYRDLDRPIATREHRGDWRRLVAEIETLRKAEADRTVRGS